jgi:predicted AlkP superfamily pyrophosphatase or phosphodiesterase
MILRALIVFWILGLAVVPAALAAPVPASDRIVVLISLDGLCGYYLDDPEADMPTIKRLAAEGASSATMKASVPTVTWTNHTTLVTGVHPAKHGVVGNNFYDRANHKRMLLLGDPDFEKDQIVRVPTIYDAAKATGLKTASVRWPASRGAKSLDWAIADVGSVDLLKRSTTPALLAELKEAGLWKEVDEAEAAANDGGKFLLSDETCTRAFELILRRHRPNLALLHLIDVDGEQHKFGPRTPEAYRAIREIDARVRSVWETMLTEYGPDKATIVLAADHGFSPIRRQILPNVVLRKAKLLNEVTGDDANAEARARVRVVMQGGCAMLYLFEDDGEKRAELVASVKKAFAGLEGVAKVAGPDELPAYGVARVADDPHAPDMVLFADMGYAFGDTTAGDVPYEIKPQRKGSHGHDPALPELRASFVACGAGIRPGVKLGDIENTAVTPTIAKLLGVKMSNLDAEPLTAALTDAK